MKKNKILALALAGAITCMGAGYAAWTDSVSIETTVESGKLRVIFEDSADKYKNEAFFVTYKNGKVHTQKLTNEEAKIDDKDPTKFTINASKYLMMPSRNVTPRDNNGNVDGRELPGLRIRTCMVNDGTIPAKFDNIEITGPTDQDAKNVYDMLKVERFVGVRVFDGMVQGNFGTEWKDITSAEGDWRGNDRVIKAIIKFMKDNDSNLIDYNLNSPQLIQKINSIFAGVVLEDSETVSLVTQSDLIASKEFAPRLRIYLDNQAKNDTENCEGCTFTIDFNWKQVNQ